MLNLEGLGRRKRRWTMLSASIYFSNT